MAATVPTVAPALALCVWHRGEDVLDVHAGSIDPDQPDDPVGDGTLFDLASVTKLFTTTAFLSLATERGAGLLDEAVVSIVPELGDGGPRTIDGGQDPLSRRLLPVPPERTGWTIDPAAVTFRQLLTHTSGLAPWRSIFRDTGPPPPPPGQPDPRTDEQRLRAGLTAVCTAPFVARPGEELHYSDLGFMLLGEAVSRLTAAPLDEAVRLRVTDPLGLESIGYVPAQSGVPLDHIVPTSVDDDWRLRRCRGEVEDENAAGLGGIAGHAGLFGCARDVARFGQAWLTGDARLGIGPELLADAWRDQTPGLAAARGLGWQLRGSNGGFLAPLGHGSAGHTGFTGTSLAVDPERELVVTLLTNRVHAGRRHEGIARLRAELHEALVHAIDRGRVGVR